MRKTDCRMKKRKLNEQGASLVAVIIAIGLVSVLAITCMYMSYANYVMKNNQIRNKMNFYTAEAVMDQIKIGLQFEVSSAIEGAYEIAAQTLTSMTTQEREENFRSSYLNKLSSLLSVGNDTTKYFVGDYEEASGASGFYRYLDEPLIDMVVNEKKRAAGGVSNSAIGYLKISAENGENQMIVTNEGLLLKNFLLEFTDAKGYYTEIKTDIRLSYPNISMADQAEFPNVELYSMIADNGFDATNSGMVSMTGNIYAGNHEEGTEAERENVLYGFHVEGSTKMELTGLGIGDNKSFIDLIVSGGINVNMESEEYVNRNTAFVTEKCNIWADDINLNSSKFEVKNQNSSIFLSDDLTMIGTSNAVKIAGSYMGYGDGNDYLNVNQGQPYQQADFSSAIIVNAKNSMLDLSDVSSMYLAGNAFLNAQKVDTLTAFRNDAMSADPNAKNILTGNSLALKTDQISLLIPRSCIGVYDQTTVIGKNPMTANEYYTWLHYTDELSEEERAKFLKVDFSKSMDAIGVDMTKYLSGPTEDNYQVVCERNGNDTLYYFYASFSDVNSSLFLQEYSQVARESVKKYIHKYQNEVRLPANQEDITSRGNLMSCTLSDTQERTSFSLLEYTVDEIDKLNNMNEYSQKQTNSYQTMKALMTTNTTAQGDKQKTAYENLIKEEAIQSNVPFGSAQTYAKDGIQTVIVNNRKKEMDGSYTYTEPYVVNSEEIGLVIASGDVEIGTNFCGLVMAGGHVKLRAGYDMNASPDKVRKALSILVPGTDQMVVAVYFVNGENYQSGNVISTSHVSYSNVLDLIVYENWQKR